MRKLTIMGLFLWTIHLTYGQNTNQSNPFLNAGPVDRFSIGLGGGLDFGGFGGNLTYYPAENIGLFGGAGYALAGVGLNAGIKYRYIPKKAEARVRPFALGMYGYNAAVAVLNRSNLNKLFYGPTLGAGIDFLNKSQRRGYWSLAIFVPFRNSDVQPYIEDLENNYGADFSNSLFPVTVSIGYKFVLF